MPEKSMRERIQEREREREMIKREMEQEERTKAIRDSLELNRRELTREEERNKKQKTDGFEKLVEKLREESKKRMEAEERDQSPDKKKSILFDRISEAYDILEKKGRIGK